MVSCRERNLDREAFIGWLRAYKYSGRIRTNAMTGCSSYIYQARGLKDAIVF